MSIYRLTSFPLTACLASSRPNFRHNQPPRFDSHPIEYLSHLFEEGNPITHESVMEETLSHFVFKKKIELFDGIERLTLRCRFDYRIHLAKMELFEQINDLTISFSAKGFFVMDRQFLGEVSSFRAIPQCHC